ncbi:lamin tail domain-containing protein [Pontiellaceae bacterium B1224]|nr:lamin tail domain-containing protein [Pontiellaceae bacterium B1224]
MQFRKKKLTFALFIGLALVSGSIQAADVYISEFMASNTSTSLDEFYEASDWIEIYNDSSLSINLAGWSLTDNPTHLTKWTFPSVTVGSKGYLLVRASGRDTVENGELHTSFKLDGDGEYLALVQPDGITVQHDFAPAYPDQKKDVSYGLAFTSNGDEVTLSDSQTACKYLVPSSDLGTAWHETVYDDSAWQDGLTPIGYDRSSNPVIVTYQAEDNSATSGCSVQSSWSGYTGTGYMDMGGVGSYFEWNTIDGAGGGTTTLNFIYASSTDRPCTISVNGTDVGTVDFTATGGFSSWESKEISVPLNSGANVVRVIAATSAGGPNVDLLEIVVSTSGSGPYDDLINTDVEGDMYGIRASMYMRIPFVVDDPAELSDVMLRMSYEDGYSAYLNGTPIASDNLPSGSTPTTLAWNAGAQTARNESDAVTMMPVFTSSSPASYLVPGTNMLVIHGLNKGTSSSDFLMQTEITASLQDGFQGYTDAYFAMPSPGYENSGEALGFVADTTFSVDRGFYSNAFDVIISTDTGGATIHYTLDGSTPSEVNGIEYTAPIPIAGTTVLRAIAFKAGWESSDVDTQTYIFPEDVVQQPELPAGWPAVWTGDYSDYEMDPDIITNPVYAAEFPAVFLRIPTISIVTDQDNLFGSSGIYDNSTREGVAWERPASAELIHPDGSKGFQVNCGLRIQGGASRIASRSAKHSFRLLFKDIYGPTKLNYDLFKDSPVDSFDTIILRAGYNNSWIHMSGSQRNKAQYARDLFARRAQAAMGQPASHGMYVHLYVNGLYWGIYNPSERPEATFASDHMGGDKDEWDATNSGTTPFTDGDAVAYETMVDIATNGLSSLADYQTFMQYCDVENLADYMIVNHFIGNGDWDHKNWYGARRRRAGEGYKFFCWDSEQSLTSAGANTTGKHNSGKPTDLFHNARTNEEFRLLFADRLHKHLFNDGALTPASTSNLWKEISNELDDVVVAESARWGDWRTTNVPYTVNDHYLPEQTNILHTILPGRTVVVLDQYVSMGLYPDLAAPEFGSVVCCFTNMLTVGLNGPTNMYYTTDGTDPREFGTGAIHGALYQQEILLSHSARIMARCYDGITWSALAEREFCTAVPALVISEIMHSPRIPDAGEIGVSGDANDYQFIELYNVGPDPVGLSGLMFVNGVRFDFSDHDLLTLLPGEYALVVRDRAAFLARYPGLELKIAGEFVGRLSGDGEQIQLDSAAGDKWEISYGDGRDWPLAADGAGHSLVLNDSDAGNLSYGGHWSASAMMDGSPGAAEPVFDTSLCLNEITGHTDLNDPAYPDYDSNDWIELFNAGTSTVSLAGYYLSDDPYDLLKWAVPTGLDLGPGGFITFDEISGFHAPVTSGFGINKAGEQILLTYAPDGVVQRVVDSHEFKGQVNGISIGRYPDGADYWVSTLPTPGTNNVMDGQQVVISEVMYHPVEDGGTNENTNLEFIELYNPSGSAVPLWSMDGVDVLGSWRIKGDVSYTFPSNTTLTVNQRVLVVPFNPLDTTLRGEFMSYYGMPYAPPMFGPFDGKLSDQGGRITLEKPQAPDAFDENISWVIVDELFFSEAEPWMPAADGVGYALHRVSNDTSAADPGSWQDAVPSPGTASVFQPDLLITSFWTSGNQALFDFQLLPDTEYTLEYSTNLTDNVWMPGATLENQINYTVPISSETNALYYRLKRK